MCRQAGVNLAHHRGRGVRSGRDLRDAAAPARTERRGAHHRRRVGCPHRRRAGALRAVAPARLPDDLLAAIDALLPPRWSRGNPIDLAAAETRDTIPQILELLAAHESGGRGALPRLGSAVEPGEAHAHRRLRVGPRPRAHRRVPRTPGRARTRRSPPMSPRLPGKPILMATELAVTDPDNPGPRTVRETGKVCYWSANRAVTALEHLWRRARFLERRPTIMSVWQRVVATILVIGAVVAVALAFTDDNAASGTTASRARSRPRLCGRRAAVPQPLVDAVGAQRLAGRARRRLSAATAPASSSTAAARSWRATTPTLPLIGASTQKVLVAAAMLADPRARFHLRDEGRRARRTRQRIRRSTVPGRQRRPGARHQRVPRLPPDPTAHQG